MQALGSLPQTSGRPASEPSGRLDATSTVDDPTGRRAVSTSAIAASPFANGGTDSFDRRGSPALGPGVPVEALAAAMPSSHSAPQLEEGEGQSGAAASGRARAAEQATAAEDGHAERRASGADGNVSVSAAAPSGLEPRGGEKAGSENSSGGRSPSVSGLLKGLPDQRPPPWLDCGGAHAGVVAGESPRSVTSPRDLGVFASYPIPEEEPEAAEGEQAGAAEQLPDAQEAAAAVQPGKVPAGKTSGGGQKREAAALDADGSSAVQQQQLMAGSEGAAAGLRGTAAH